MCPNCKKDLDFNLETGAKKHKNADDARKCYMDKMKLIKLPKQVLKMDKPEDVERFERNMNKWDV